MAARKELEHDLAIEKDDRHDAPMVTTATGARGATGRSYTARAPIQPPETPCYARATSAGDGGVCRRRYTGIRSITVDEDIALRQPTSVGERGRIRFPTF